MLTLEARRAGADDVTGIMYPEAIARANGTDVKTAIDTFIKTMADAGKAAGAQESTFDVLAEIMALAGDAASIENWDIAGPGARVDREAPLQCPRRERGWRRSRARCSRSSWTRWSRPAPGPRFAVGGIQHRHVLA